MKIARMFEIVYLLMSRDRVTVKELAARFEVSPRTIHRDIDSLMQAGIPIYTSRGSGGGVSLVEGFVIDKALLSDDEQAQILQGLQGFPQGGTLSEGELLKKLTALFNKDRTDWLEVDFSRWGHAAKDDERFDTLRQAILGQTSVMLTYVNSTGENSEREVYPLKLIFKSKAWYLQAYCLSRQDYRTFRITRIVALELTNHTFDHAQYQVPPLERAGERMYDFVKLELAFKPVALSRVYDEFDIQSIEVDDEGNVHVFTDYPDSSYLYTVLASFGGDVAVISPDSVREKLRTIHEKAQI